MMDVLFGHVGIVPNHFLFESSGRRVMLDFANLCANDAFEGVKHRTGTNSLYRVGPLRSLAEVHCVVIPVGEPESDGHASGGLDAQRINEFFPQKPHGRGAEDDDTLVV
jgi:hypothetical protein